MASTAGQNQKKQKRQQARHQGQPKAKAAPKASLPQQATFVQTHKRTCLYDVLEVPRNADDETLKKAYRKAALRWHPDKNIDQLETANARFKEIQGAWEVLSNPHERSFYDDHRDEFIRGLDPNSAAAKGDNREDQKGGLQEYFSPTCFSGFDDDAPHSYYAVYGKVFRDIAASELSSTSTPSTTTTTPNTTTKKAGDDQTDPNTLGEDDDDDEGDEEADKEQQQREEEEDEEQSPTQQQRPELGGSDSSPEEVKAFYQSWSSFASRRTFAWHDLYRPNAETGRRERRLMEKENLRLRAQHKREYNDSVRNLVAHIKQFDPRVVAALLLRREAELEAEYQEDVRRVEAAQLRMKLREEQAAVEALRLAEQERAHRERYGDDSANEDEERGRGGGDEDGEEVNFVCEICRKTFKSDNQRDNHEKSKKHKDAVKKFGTKGNSNNNKGKAGEKLPQKKKEPTKREEPVLQEPAQQEQEKRAEDEKKDMLPKKDVKPSVIILGLDPRFRHMQVVPWRGGQRRSWWNNFGGSPVVERVPKKGPEERKEVVQLRLKATVAAKHYARAPDNEDLLFARIEAEHRMLMINNSFGQMVLRDNRQKQFGQLILRDNTQKQAFGALVTANQFSKHNSSKALASQFVFKANAAHDATARAEVHHFGGGGGGSHYNMAGSKQQMKGVKVKGVISRHSRQGAKVQGAKQNPVAEMARGQRGKS